MKPKVSVLLPCLNALPYVEHAVGSILCQTFQDFELVLVDNGSADGTFEYLKSLTDRRVRVHQCLEQGLGRALNFGLARCTGELVARMDGDDVSLPARLEIQVAWMDAHPEYSAVGAQYRFLVGDRTMPAAPVEVRHEALRRQFMRGIPSLCHPSLVFRRMAAMTFGGYHVCGWGEDLDFYMRLSECGRVGAVSETLLLYRLHRGSVTMLKRRAIRLGNEYAVECARSRRACRPEPTLDAFLIQKRHKLGLHGTIDAYGSALYRESLMCRMGDRNLKAYSLAIAAGLMQPRRAAFYLGRLVRGLRAHPAGPTLGSPISGSTRPGPSLP